MTPLTAYKIAKCNKLDGARTVYEISDETRGVRCHVKDGVLYVGFHATKGWIFPPSKDWWKNLMFWLHTGPYGLRSVTGFWNEYESIRMELCRVVQREKPTSIEVGAYSQGGPHAEDFMVDLIRKVGFKGQITVDTFGAPANWEKTSAKKVRKMMADHGNATLRRWVVRGDPVPKLPPPILGSHHLVDPIYIGEWSGLDWVFRHMDYEKILERVE